MHKYGIVLQNYEKNSEIVNESVFTMMHHISKIENSTALYQPIILKTFLKMFENNDFQYKVRMKYYFTSTQPDLLKNNVCHVLTLILFVFIKFRGGLI